MNCEQLVAICFTNYTNQRRTSGPVEWAGLREAGLRGKRGICFSYSSNEINTAFHCPRPLGHIGVTLRRKWMTVFKIHTGWRGGEQPAGGC